MENNRDYWEEYWDKENRSLESKFLFGDLIEKFKLEIDSYFEIGCAPGSIMSFFNKNYGCRVEGIDFTSSSRIIDFLKQSGIDDYQVYQDDIFDFDIDKVYDFVGSYGFIEHFDNPGLLIQKHKQLVTEGGYLCITVPNMRYFNYFVNYIFSKELVKNHNLKIMDLKLLKKLILDDEFQEIYANYYLTSLFQANSDSQRLKKYPMIQRIYGILNKIMSELKLDNVPNRFMSPYIVVLAKKREKSKSEGNIKILK